MNHTDEFTGGLRKKVIVCVIAAVIVIGIIVGLGIFCFIDDDQPESYFLEYNGEVMDGQETISLQNGEEYSFSIKSETGEAVAYTAKVTSNPERNFSFKVGEEQRWFYDAAGSWNDYTKIFDLQQSGEKVTLTVPKDFSVKQAIEERHGGEIVWETGEELKAANYFQLVIAIGGKELCFGLAVDSVVTGIEIDPPSITF